MKAMLLAAGIGSRLGPLTHDRPKCMIRIDGREVILRNIDWLRSNGIDDLVINLHHGADSVIAAIGDGSRWGVTVTYSREPELLGTAGGVLAARTLIGEDTFLVVYADNLFVLPVDSVIAAHRRSGAVATMVLFEREDVSSSGVAALTEDGWITEFQEKPPPGTERSHWVNAGLLVCEPAAYESIPATVPCDLSLDVLPGLALRDRGLHGYRMKPGERLMWIDTVDDLRATETQMAFSGRTGTR